MKKKIELTYTQNYYPGTREELLEEVKARMSPGRFEHVLRVEQTALQLAQKYHADLEKVSVAALLHDYAKEAADGQMKDIIISENLDLDLLKFGNPAWHGPVAAVIARKRLSVHDEDILKAVANHTYGAPQMGLVEQIIFVADFIEPARDFPEVARARELAEASLTQAVFYELKHTLLYLIEQDHKIYPQTLASYNAWLKRIGDDKNGKTSK